MAVVRDMYTERELAAAKAENRRLRETLETIAAYPWDRDTYSGSGMELASLAGKALRDVQP